MKLTVKEYASKFNISVQAVYQKLNKGTLNSIEEDGKKYVLVDKKEVKEIKQPLEQDLNNFFSSEIKDLFKLLKTRDQRIVELEDQLKKKDKEIKKLNKEVVKTKNNENKTLHEFIYELKQIKQLPEVIATGNNEEVMEAEIEDTKKKKSKKKKKKK